MNKDKKIAREYSNVVCTIIHTMMKTMDRGAANQFVVSLYHTLVSLMNTLGLEEKDPSMMPKNG